MLGAKPPSSPTLVAEKSEKKNTEIKDLNCYIMVNTNTYKSYIDIISGCSSLYRSSNKN